jgi:tetratricopeptide (TPR) repeat protein
MEPVPLGERQSYALERRTLKLRVWVDEGYQRRVNWRIHVNAVIGRVNRYLEPAFGVTFEAEVKSWPRGGGPEDLEQVIEELVRHDAGDDVDHVVGLTGSLAIASFSHHELGLARHPGKHFVVRAMNGAEELKLLERIYPTLGKEERVGLLERRNAHKEVAVFVHEWAHNYGVMHDEGLSIMGMAYDNHAGSMSPQNAQILAAALAGQGPSPRMATPAADPEAADDRNALDEADERAARGDRRGAVEVLDARARLLPETAAARWLVLGQAYDRLGAFSRADEALARAENPEARARSTERRRQHGIHGIAPQDEPDATAAVAESHAALVEDETERAVRLVEKGLHRFPKLPGLFALRCGNALYAGRLRAAERACQAAIARWPETVFAHLFLGETHRQAGRLAAAATSLERALALDPGLQTAYQSLAWVYGQTGDRARLQALRSSYLARFGRSLD